MDISNFRVCTQENLPNIQRELTEKPNNWLLYQKVENFVWNAKICDNFLKILNVGEAPEFVYRDEWVEQNLKKI